jgi:hypothetical protein
MQHTSQADNRGVHLANTPQNMTRGDVYHFARHYLGDIAPLMSHTISRGEGWAIVIMLTHNAACKAMVRLNGVLWHNRKIKTSWATRRLGADVETTNKQHPMLLQPQNYKRTADDPPWILTHCKEKEAELDLLRTVYRCFASTKTEQEQYEMVMDESLPSVNIWHHEWSDKENSSKTYAAVVKAKLPTAWCATRSPIIDLHVSTDGLPVGLPYNESYVSYLQQRVK